MTPEQQNIQGLANVPTSLRGCVLTIGNFDGVHRGHRRILSEARSLADAVAAPVVAVTFNPPPDQVLRPDDVPQRLLPHEQKVHRLLEAGCDAVVTVPPDRALLGMPPRDFLGTIIWDVFAPRHMVEGPNFFFGRRREGTIATLQEDGRFTVHVVQPVLMELDEEPVRISSTLVRQLVAEGRMEDARLCLANPFVLFGRVEHGEAKGHELGFPTANLSTGEQIVPGDGVYAGRADVQGRWYDAAVSIGCKPTFGRGPTLVEAHLLDADENLYDREMALEVRAKVRSQEAFADMETLREQIARDIEVIRRELRNV